MHRARQHAATQTRERRHQLAHEAARLMAEGGIRDYHQAKLKAATRLGIHDDASLPRNTEIEDALREYQRLFAGADHGAQLRQRREAALRAMEFLKAFSPRLCGPVLDGTADANSPVQLQVHSDDADAVQRFFDEHGIPAESRTRRLRLDRERSLDAPVWIFSAEALTFDIAVLPYDGLRQPPLSAIDEKPMQRASAEAFAAYFPAWADTDFSAGIVGRHPLKVLVGEHDPVFNAALMERTYLRRYAHASLEVLGNAGHYPMNETPLALVTAIERFLAPFGDA